MSITNDKYITAKVVSSNPAISQMYSIQHYVPATNKSGCHDLGLNYLNSGVQYPY